MFKKALVVLSIVGMCGMAHADPIEMDNVIDKIPEIIDKIPVVNNGIAYSLADSQLNYLATIDIANYKGFIFSAGYAGRAENTKDKLVGSVTYEVVKLKDHVNIPILNLVELEVGAYAGVGRVELSNFDGELDWGLAAKIIKVNF